MEQADSHGSENAKVARAAGVVGFYTMLSRIFGFLRDMVVAAFFGAGLATDAFFVAFRIPNLLRRLLGEGSLTVSFVPVFTEYLNKKTKAEALELANIAFTILSVILVVVSISGVIFSPFIVAVMAPGFTRIPEQYELTVFLNRLMFPYIFFISLVALCMGILNALRHFAAPALSPVILNIAMIVATLTLRDFFAEPIVALAVGVMIGGVLQLAMQWPALVRMGVRLKFAFNLTHPGVKKIGLLMLPAFFGAAIYQINILIGTLLASFLPQGSVSYLYYADRIVELPLGVFAIAVGTATLPSFSDQVSRGNLDDPKNSATSPFPRQWQKTLAFSMRLILFITIPAMIALIALREPIISVLFQRGHFDATSTAMTAQALLCYAVGLWAFSVVRVIVSAFFALQDTKNPMKAAFVALIVNVIFSLLLMYPLQHGGLALATSIASAANVLLLTGILIKKIGAFMDRDFYRAVLRMILASALMWLAIVVVDEFFPWKAAGSFQERLAFLAVAIAVGAATFCSVCTAMNIPEMTALIRILRKKIGLA
jgi:putative peptidoglycan lipid II flippase